MEQYFSSLQPVLENIYVHLGIDADRLVVWLFIGLAVCFLMILILAIRSISLRRQLKQLETRLSAEQIKKPYEYKRSPTEEAAGPDMKVKDVPGDGLHEEEFGAIVPSEPLEAPSQIVEEADLLPSLREEPEEKFLERLKGRLSKTQNQLIGRLDQVLVNKKSVNSDMLEDLEEILVTADLGVKTSYQLIKDVQQELKKKSVTPDQLKSFFKEKISLMFDVESEAFNPKREKPFVILVVGVNGVGKTTTIGKLAARLKGENNKVMLVAADTFRAAAIEQLEIWSRRVDADLIKHKAEADPSAVAFDAIKAAKARDSDVVIIDTAGRLHTKTNLMEELKKIKRIIGKELESAPHEIILVLDATTGQNAINQARIFHEAIGVTGIVLTKLDGTAKGGVIVGITHELQLPVRFIGIGEGLEDLKEFSPQLFLEALFAEKKDGLLQ